MFHKLRTCDVPLGFDVSFKIGFDKGEPLLNAAFYIPTTFLNVSQNYENVVSTRMIFLDHQIHGKLRRETN